MIVSASIQAADQLNILHSIQQHSSEFDQIHVDITDGHFTNNISMSFSHIKDCLLYTSPSPRDKRLSRMPSSA